MFWSFAVEGDILTQYCCQNLDVIFDGILYETLKNYVMLLILYIATTCTWYYKCLLRREYAILKQHKNNFCTRIVHAKKVLHQVLTSDDTKLHVSIDSDIDKKKTKPAEGNLTTCNLL